MARQATVAIFSNAKEAQAAADDLLGKEIEPDDIKQYARKPDRSTAAAIMPANELQLHKSFWNWLSGSKETEEAYDEYHGRYDKVVHDGGVILTVIVDAALQPVVDGVLRSHHPTDLLVRAS